MEEDEKQKVLTINLTRDELQDLQRVCKDIEKCIQNSISNGQTDTVTLQITLNKLCEISEEIRCLYINCEIDEKELLEKLNNRISEVINRQLKKKGMV